MQACAIHVTTSVQVLAVENCLKNLPQVCSPARILDVDDETLNEAC